MRRDPYKELMHRKWLIPRIIGGTIILIVVLIVVILVQMNERSALINEGTTKSVPMLRSETVAKLGEIYIRKENEFESELKNIILGIANRKNKRGDEIYYGVNGKRNIDWMINDDYVNGVNLTYVKSDSNRADGESNFNDILAVLSSMYGADADRYEDEVIEMFENLFDISHTYNSESTDLYPCEHGCAWTKYYCGDYKVVGTLSSSEGGGGEQVKYYKCDMYMGEEGKYGLMYNPWIIKKRSNYTELLELADNERELKTTYQYKVIKSEFIETADGGYVRHYIANQGDTVVTEDNEIFELFKADGFCPVCTGGRSTFTSTTRKIAGCINHVTCHHGSIGHISSGEDDEGHDVFWYMGRDKGNCDNPDPEFDCDHEHSESCEWEEGEAEAMGAEENGCKHKTLNCKPEDIGCNGHYTCSDGHDHYACPGHIAVCCFGHTTLNLNVNILYHEGILDELKKKREEIAD